MPDDQRALRGNSMAQGVLPRNRAIATKGSAGRVTGAQHPAVAMRAASLYVGRIDQPMTCDEARHRRGTRMAYAVKELFHTLQGEGAQAGRAAVFCRFAGCNLWSGREEDRASAACRFCDTDFVGLDGEGGGRFSQAADLASAIAETWAGGEANRYVVFTGGEPLLQLDAALIEAVHAKGFEIAVETNGTLPAPDGIDWICVSPKAGNPLVQRTGHELKLVYPQDDAEPESFSSLAFTHHWLQPMDGPDRAANMRAAIEYCRRNARWRLSLQTHKIIGIP